MQKKGFNLCCGGNFFSPTPCVRQPLFEFSDHSGIVSCDAAAVRIQIRIVRFKNQEKGVLAKGVTPKETKHTQGQGPSSTFGTQSVTAERGVHFCKNPLLKTPFSWFLSDANGPRNVKNSEKAGPVRNSSVCQNRRNIVGTELWTERTLADRERCHCFC